MNNDECLHENIAIVRVGPYGPERECEDCGHDVDADGPPDDEWIAAAYERMVPRAVSVGLYGFDA